MYRESYLMIADSVSKDSQLKNNEIGRQSSAKLAKKLTRIISRLSIHN